MKLRPTQMDPTGKTAINLQTSQPPKEYNLTFISMTSTNKDPSFPPKHKVLCIFIIFIILRNKAIYEACEVDDSKCDTESSESYTITVP
jgi:hypothetical protein